MRMGGYQGDFDGSATYSGIMYGEAFRGILANLGTVSRVNGKGEIQEVARFATPEEIRANVKIEDWNHYEITARFRLRAQDQREGNERLYRRGFRRRAS